VLTPAEIDAAFGRTGTKPGRPGRGTAGGISECRFAGGGRGDVRVVVHPRSSAARSDFDLRPEILELEGQVFERRRDVGDGIILWGDAVEVLVGQRRIELWVTRTGGTEAAGKVREALTRLARAAAGRLAVSADVRRPAGNRREGFSAPAVRYPSTAGRRRTMDGRTYPNSRTPDGFPLAAAEPPRAEPVHLTPQERQLLWLLIEGHSKKSVARAMRISVNTVSFHLKNLYLKLRVHSKTAAVAAALRGGLVFPRECVHCRRERTLALQSLGSDIARYSQARANVHSRSTVARDVPTVAAISSIVSPPKNLSSTI
jgi:DNA-binding CsgD family transcriptional regulator